MEFSFRKVRRRFDHCGQGPHYVVSAVCSEPRSREDKVSSLGRTMACVWPGLCDSLFMTVPYVRGFK